ncbi:MAG: hypothetical protein J3R72DRAFT_451471 [Linnemannia gamsii]|nr:MAG: hypothetical protein J3R72DRAFT_451471 [Linnemannia gamsii]
MKPHVASLLACYQSLTLLLLHSASSAPITVCTKRGDVIADDQDSHNYWMCSDSDNSHARLFNCSSSFVWDKQLTQCVKVATGQSTM